MNWYLFVDVIAWFWAVVGISALFLYFVKAKLRDGTPFSAGAGANGGIIALISIAYLIARL